MKVNIGETAAAAGIILFGLVMTVKGASYPLGSISQMGPGYFPVHIGIATMALGAATLLSVLRSSVPAPEVPWRAFFLVFAGVLLWGLLAERFGLVPASVVLLVFSSLARPPVRLLTMVLTTVIVTAGSVLLFIGGFGLPLKAFKW